MRGLPNVALDAIRRAATAHSLACLDAIRRAARVHSLACAREQARSAEGATSS